MLPFKFNLHRYSEAVWSAPPLEAASGTLYKYIKCVESASKGCITDFNGDA
jgi:hypothetical protein